jgi:hypothetical protein
MTASDLTAVDSVWSELSCSAEERGAEKPPTKKGVHVFTKSTLFTHTGDHIIMTIMIPSPVDVLSDHPLPSTS